MTNYFLKKTKPLIPYVALIMIFAIILLIIISKYDNKLDLQEIQISGLNKQIESLKEVNQQLVDVSTSEKQTIINNYEEILNKQNDQLASAASTLEELKEVNNINKDLLSKNQEANYLLDKMNDRIKELEEKLKYYEEFEVFMYDTDNKRTDCSYETLKYLDSLIENEAVNNLPFYCAWIMIESEWHSNCKNKTSTASGLPQFLSGTGKWVYEDLMGNGKGTYDHHTMPFKSEISLQMMVTYLKELMKQHKGNLHKVIDSYRGLHDGPYLRKFDQYLSYFNTSIDEIADISLERYNKLSA